MGTIFYNRFVLDRGYGRMFDGDITTRETTVSPDEFIKNLLGRANPNGVRKTSNPLAVDFRLGAFEGVSEQFKHANVEVVGRDDGNVIVNIECPCDFCTVPEYLGEALVHYAQLPKIYFNKDKESGRATFVEPSLVQPAILDKVYKLCCSKCKFWKNVSSVINPNTRG